MLQKLYGCPYQHSAIEVGSANNCAVDFIISQKLQPHTLFHFLTHVYQVKGLK